MKKQRKSFWRRTREKVTNFRNRVREKIKKLAEYLSFKDSSKVKRFYTISNCKTYIKVYKFIKKGQKWVCALIYAILISISTMKGVYGSPRYNSAEFYNQRTPIENIRLTSSSSNFATFNQNEFNEFSKSLGNNFEQKVQLPGADGFPVNGKTPPRQSKFCKPRVNQDGSRFPNVVDWPKTTGISSSPKVRPIVRLSDNPHDYKSYGSQTDPIRVDYEYNQYMAKMSKDYPDFSCSRERY